MLRIGAALQFISGLDTKHLFSVSCSLLQVNITQLIKFEFRLYSCKLSHIGEPLEMVNRTRSRRMLDLAQFVGWAEDPLLRKESKVSKSVWFLVESNKVSLLSPFTSRLHLKIGLISLRLFSVSPTANQSLRERERVWRVDFDPNLSIIHNSEKHYWFFTAIKGRRQEV